jgi:glycosyltransferase involved in cell wall biosynthesis
VATIAYDTHVKSSSFFLSRKEKFHLIHATVNTEIFKIVDKKIARKNIGVSEKEKIILYVGRITSRKGGDFLHKVIKSNPQIKFIIIGKWLENEIPKFKYNNMIVLNKVENKKLNEYYSAADLVFAYHRQGCQMGIVGAESLSCGVPIIHTKRIAFEDSSAIFKVLDNLQDFNKKIKDFFLLSEIKEAEIRKKAREYALENLSDEVWKEKYLKFYLD